LVLIVVRLLPTAGARWVRFLWVIGILVVLAIAGVLLGRVISKVGPRGVLLVPLGLFVVWGVVLAVRDSWFAQNMAWVLPLSITLLIGIVPWLGGLIYSEYFHQFDIPENSVSIESAFRIAAAGKPAFIGLAFAMFLISLVGWARHFYLAEGLADYRP